MRVLLPVILITSVCLLVLGMGLLLWASSCEKSIFTASFGPDTPEYGPNIFYFEQAPPSVLLNKAAQVSQLRTLSQVLLSAGTTLVILGSGLLVARGRHSRIA